MARRLWGVSYIVTQHVIEASTAGLHILAMAMGPIMKHERVILSFI